MCGITGWVDFGRDLWAEPATIEAMTATMTCRGPDAGGVWLSSHAALGHRRLAVIDIAGGGQPMHAPAGDGDGVVLTFSGEIYNFTGLTRWLPMLLDRKDRLSMASGLEYPFACERGGDSQGGNHAGLHL